MDLLKALLALSEGATGQLAALVGHEVAALCKRQVLQVQDLTCVCVYVYVFVCACAWRACVYVCFGCGCQTRSQLFEALHQHCIYM